MRCRRLRGRRLGDPRRRAEARDPGHGRCPQARGLPPLDRAGAPGAGEPEPRTARRPGRSGKRELILRTMGRIEQTEPVQGHHRRQHGGQPIRVKDVGTVNDDVEEPRSLGRLDGDNCRAAGRAEAIGHEYRRGDRHGQEEAEGAGRRRLPQRAAAICAWRSFATSRGSSTRRSTR